MDSLEQESELTPEGAPRDEVQCVVGAEVTVQLLTFFHPVCFHTGDGISGLLEV